MSLVAPMQGTVVLLGVADLDVVAAGTTIVVLESMKMEHPIVTDTGGRVQLLVGVGDTVTKGQELATFTAVDRADPGETADSAVGGAAPGATVDGEPERGDLAMLVARRQRISDSGRADAVAKRHDRGHRTAHENVADLVDAGTFVEYGSMVIAAQRRRRELDDLIDRTSNDGIVTGLGSINGEHFAADAAAAAVLVYDYTVLAGTQGMRGHHKTDRLLRIAHERRLPLVLFAEGGGGRPGDVDSPTLAGLQIPTFSWMAKMSGRAPTVAIVNGYCFAGNAVLAACADLVIATEGSNLGAGGPAMVEGGGLGVYAPTEIGPVAEHVASGVVDLVADDEAHATELTKTYLAYFQGELDDWSMADQSELRHAVPENRVRSYDVRRIIELLADTDSTLELRPDFGVGIITTLARVEGRPVGIVANNTLHLSGAIDREGADKGSRFIRLCDAYGIAVVVLCDTPGIMVGPESERDGTLRHAARLFVAAANATVPIGTVVLRKGYGLGAMAMAAGGFFETEFTVSWPTGEFGGMNLEGAVRLGYRKELEAIDDPVERERYYDEAVARSYEAGRAIRAAEVHEIDEVIDPAETRAWIRSMFAANPRIDWRAEERVRFLDTW